MAQLNIEVKEELKLQAKAAALAAGVSLQVWVTRLIVSAVHARQNATPQAAPVNPAEKKGKI